MCVSVKDSAVLSHFLGAFSIETPASLTRFVRCSNYGSSLAEDTLPNLHRLGAVQSDVVLFNFGVWHNDLQSFQGNVSLVASFLRQHRHELPLLIWRETAPQHFDTPLGEFACDGCPEAQGPYKCKVSVLARVLRLAGVAIATPLAGIPAKTA